MIPDDVREIIDYAVRRYADDAILISDSPYMAKAREDEYQNVRKWLDSQPTMRKWDTMPDVDGWYWYRYAGTNDCCTCYVDTGRVNMHGDTRWLTNSQCRGTWYGPLMQPWEDNNDTE